MKANSLVALSTFYVAKMEITRLLQEDIIFWRRLVQAVIEYVPSH